MRFIISCGATMKICNPFSTSQVALTRYLSFHVLAAWGKDRVDRIRECAPHLLVAALCDRLYKFGMGLKFAASSLQHTSDFKMTRPSQLHPMHSTRSATLAHTSSRTRCVKHHPSPQLAHTSFRVFYTPGSRCALGPARVALRVECMRCS